jgi:hypothetical protein
VSLAAAVSLAAGLALAGAVLGGSLAGELRERGLREHDWSFTRTSWVLSCPVASTCNADALRRLLWVSSSPAGATTSTVCESRVPVSPTAARRTASAADVLGCSPSTNPLTTDTRPWLLRSDRAPRSAAAFIFLGVRWT